MARQVGRKTSWAKEKMRKRGELTSEVDAP